MNLFEYAAESLKEKEAPLAARMRPKTLEEVVGGADVLIGVSAPLPCNQSGPDQFGYFLWSAGRGENHSGTCHRWYYIR